MNEKLFQLGLSASYDMIETLWEDARDELPGMLEEAEIDSNSVNWEEALTAFRNGIEKAMETLQALLPSI